MTYSPDPGPTETASQPSLARGAATITLATAISRITGFLRVVAVAGAMGATFLTDTYNSANTAPNLVFELLAAGVLTSVFVPTFVEYIAKGSRDEGWDAGNALTSVAVVVLTVIAAVVALAAPWIMKLFLIGRPEDVRAASVDVGADFLRLFAPQIVLYGAGMIMTGALHAHRRFAMPAIAPIFNNVVVIAVYLTYAAMRSGQEPTVEGITTAQTWVLGAGTTLGVVAMTVCLIPSLRSLGWRFRFRFQPGHPAVKRGARLGVWALGYAGGYQAGLIVVLILANRIAGGVAAYQWAYTFFYLPHALFGVPIFNVLFTAMAEHVARDESRQVARRLSDGLRMLGFILLPVSAALIVLAEPLTRVTLQYGVMTPEGAELVARVLMAFAVGLPAYSAFLVITRAFYALSDTRTPTLVNAGTVVVTSVLGAVLFFAADERWSVAGLALAHSIGFLGGAVVLGAALARRLGPIVDARTGTSLARSTLLACVAGVAMWAATSAMGDEAKAEALAVLGAAGAVGAIVYLGGAMLLRSQEAAELGRLVRSLTGRRA